MKTYKYQMHTHTAPCRGCATMTPDELAEAMHEGGYQGCVMTNHFMEGNTGIDRELTWNDFVRNYEEDYIACDDDPYDLAQAQQLVGAEVFEAAQGRGAGPFAAVGDQIAHGAVDVHEAHRGDDGRHPRLGDQQAHQRAANGADAHGDQEAEQRGLYVAVLQQHADGHARQRQRGRDRDVDAAHQHHAQHAQGHDQRDGVVAQHVGDGLEGEERRVDDRHDGEHRDDDDEQKELAGARQLLQFHAAPPFVVEPFSMAKSSIFSWVASSRFSTPVMRPLHMTTIRSAMPRISGISEEISMMA